MASRYGTGSTFDGSQRQIVEANPPRSAEAAKCVTKFETMWDAEAPPSRAAKRRNKRALEHLIRAAELGCSTAAANLAEIYFNGSVAGVTRDLTKMFHYYVLVLERPDESLHEVGAGSICRVLLNLYSAVCNLDSSPAEWLVPRLDAVLALDGWHVKQPQRIDRVVLMVLNHTVGHLAWFSGDRFKAVKKLHASTAKWEKLRAAGFGITGAPRQVATPASRLMLLNYKAQCLAEKMVASNAATHAMMIARMADDDDDGSECVQVDTGEVMSEIEDRYAVLKRNSDYNYESDNKYKSAHVGEGFVAEGSDQVVHMFSAMATSEYDGEKPQTFQAGEHTLHDMRLTLYDSRLTFCDHCGQQDAPGKRLNKCPCELVRYCNTKCQKAARKAHRRECKAALAQIQAK